MRHGIGTRAGFGINVITGTVNSQLEKEKLPAHKKNRKAKKM